MPRNFKGIETKLIHSGEPDPRIQGAISMPIFQTAMFEYAGEKGYHAIRYIRLNNTPNHLALHQKLAALENAEAALVTASGMAAISTTLLAVLSSGDHLLAQDCLYGGTHDFVTEDFASFGIGYEFIDGEDPASWKKKLRPNTRAVYVETITNPLLKVADLKAVVEFAREHGLISIIDNTFASPVNFRPAEWGFDLSLHSCTKYLNGLSAMLSFEVRGGVEAAERFMQKTELPIVAPSLGGVETLLTRPATTSHSGMSPQDRLKAGITDSLVRMSVGLEAAEDLIEDLERALAGEGSQRARKSARSTAH